MEVVSTSGTAKLLQESGLSVRQLDTMTGFPEILAGRVKTLHPHVHGAILLRRKDPVQAREAAALGIEPIDLVVVNLYPFARTAAEASDPYSQDVIEQIDIGGVALIRAAASRPAKPPPNIATSISSETGSRTTAGVQGSVS